ncbi:ankyrin repeat domain-containing protein 40 isoform 1-T1 [Sylvia borin]
MCCYRLKQAKIEVLQCLEGISTPELLESDSAFMFVWQHLSILFVVRKKTRCFLMHLLTLDAFSTAFPLYKKKKRKEKKKKKKEKRKKPNPQVSLGEYSLVFFTVEDELTDLKQDSDLPIIPNYLANPPFPYVYNTSSTSIPDPTLNGNLSHLEPQDTNSPSAPDSASYRRAGAPLQPGNGAPEAPPNGDVPPLPRGCAGPSYPNPVLQRAPPYQGSVSWGRSRSPAGSNQSLPQQGNSSCVGPVPAFQPIFFTGAFPLNMQELVLKVRIQTPNLRENDFIEIELDRQELTYKELLRVSCRELGVNPEHVQKIRKLPNTMLRKDKDVARLQDFQELELVLTVSDKNLLFRVSTLSEQSGYNKKASELTY